MNEKRKRRTLHKRDEVSLDDALATFKLPAPTVLSRAELEQHLSAARFEPNKATKQLCQISEILKHPRRVLVLLPERQQFVRPVIIFDKARGEFIEFKVRVGFFNKMSLAGVEFVDVRADAEAWARMQTSGRNVGRDGTIE